MKSKNLYYGEVLLLLSAYNMEQQLVEKADVYSQSALAIYPDSPDAQEIRAYVLLVMERLEECEDLLSQITREGSRNLEYVRARLSMIKNDPDAAQRHLKKYLKLVARKSHKEDMSEDLS